MRASRSYFRSAGTWGAVLSICVMVTGGCGSPRQYFHNGWKVGPQYSRPAASVAPAWIDGANPKINACPGTGGSAFWWETLGDPVLSSLIQTAYEQNLTLRAAGMRVLQARAQRDIVRGNLFPQIQDAFGGYARVAESLESSNRSSTGKQFFDDWIVGGQFIWELDFWGKFRRSVAAADAQLDAEVEDYDDVLVILVSDVASAYVDFRTFDQRLKFARQNLDIQSESVRLAQAKKKAEARESELDLPQAKSNVAETSSFIPQFELNRRLAMNRLSVLLGMPPSDIAEMLGPGDIPPAPAAIAIGIPADILRQRPDVQSAERELAAQSEEIGIAVADLYPHLSITGTIFWNADSFGDMFRGTALSGAIGPSFRWDLLNYGRLRGRIREQQARFNELLYDYKQSVLSANEEAENAVATYLYSHQTVLDLEEGAESAAEAVRIASRRYEQGVSGFNRLFNLQVLLARQQDSLAVARGDTVQGLIDVYRSLGGGWQIRMPRPSSPELRVLPPTELEEIAAPVPMARAEGEATTSQIADAMPSPPADGTAVTPAPTEPPEDYRPFMQIVVRQPDWQLPQPIDEAPAQVVAQPTQPAEQELETPERALADVTSENTSDKLLSQGEEAKPPTIYDPTATPVMCEPAIEPTVPAVQYHSMQLQYTESTLAKKQSQSQTTSPESEGVLESKDRHRAVLFQPPGLTPPPAPAADAPDADRSNPSPSLSPAVLAQPKSVAVSWIPKRTIWTRDVARSGHEIDLRQPTSVRQGAGQTLLPRVQFRPSASAPATARILKPG